ncbi:MAG: hydrogenase nickel incorporation protein HypB [Chloroflexi bacterium]|nr:hydrogenase nickel incorporation protein HypB [Chloroflexota bacterium]
MRVEKIDVIKNILVGNDEIAQGNQARFQEAGVFAVNVMASPGAGKTSLITRTIEALRSDLRVGVIEGDIAGSIDTEAVLSAGAADALQINTGGNCHLEANMVQKASDRMNLDALDLLFVENVGNLICPTNWSLGEHMRLCLLSVPEGHDKPIKYPQIFAVSDAIIVNKIDLLPWVKFDTPFFYDSVRALNQTAPIFEVSCQTGQGVEAWIAWLRARRQAAFALEGTSVG